METGRIEIKTVLISVVVAAVIEATLGIITSTGADSFSSMFLLGTARFLEAALILLIVLNREGRLSHIGLVPSGILSGLKRGLVWSAGFGTIVLLVSAALFAAGIDPLALIHTSLPAGRSDIALFFLVGGIVSPIAEER